MRYSSDPSQLGTKLGPKLAKMVADAIIESNRGLTRHKHDVGMAIFNSASDQISDEVHQTLGPLLGQMLNEDLPDHSRKLIEQFHHKHGQLTALAGQQIIGSTLGQAISPLLNSGLYGTTSRVLSAGLADQPPDTGTLASMLARGIGNAGVAAGDMTGQGMRPSYIADMEEAARSYPELSVVIELLNKRLISVDQAHMFLTRNGIPAGIHNQLLGLTRAELSPADAADMVVRGIIGQAEGESIAAKSGLIASDFDKMVLDTGEPLGLEQMLEARRRGFIDQAFLEHGIRQSRIRNEWIPTAEKLAFEPMSTADAVNAVVQGHMDMATGERLASQNGLEAGQFPILYETAGEPLSRTEMEELFNRGMVTQADVNQALRESRVKNKYVDLAFQLHRKIPPLFTVERALGSGGITHEQAVTAIMDAGYSKDDAAWIVAAGSASRTKSSQDKLISAVETLYEDNAISAGDALSAIKAHGFSQTEADLVVQAAEFRREAKITSQVLSVVKTKYLSRKISRNQASGMIDGIGMPTQQRDTMLALWDIERSAYTRTLTEAQIVKAVKLALITDQDALTRLVDMGYSADDADLLLKGA